MKIPSLPLFSISILDLHRLYFYFYSTYIPEHQHLFVNLDIETINFMYDQVIEVSARSAIAQISKEVTFAPNIAKDYHNAGLPVKDLALMFVPKIKSTIEQAGLTFHKNMVIKFLSAGTNLFIVKHTVTSFVDLDNNTALF